MVNFLLGFHCHQPVGNFEGVFKEVHNKSYSPLIRTLLKYDSCKFCLHMSGYLLEWIVKNDPELIELIKEGVSKHKVEMLGGGYYEPVLASIPLSDRIKQLEMLNEAVKKYFGVYPEGAWITERIWQPDIIDSLNEVGINYAFLDDSQFFQSGVDSNDIDKIFITEYNGKYLNLFPIHERLRYKLPFANPEESAHEILYMKERLSNLSVMVDDGEKMGSWPNTYEWVYGKDFNSEDKFNDSSGNGWLNKFLTISGDPSNNIKMKLPSELIDEISIRQPVYLP
ncbi:MAG: glycoside hydrolase family 38 N-terminal domain-containing protein [bacterium]